MNLESLVTSLETSKKLAEIGLKRETVFYWYEYSYDGWVVNTRGQLPFFAEPEDDNMFPAYTAQEIAAELPEIIHPDTATDSDYHLNIFNHEDVWFCCYRRRDKMLRLICDDPNLAECLGRMRVLLSENGYPLCD
jgi:hypothetical protein